MCDLKYKNLRYFAKEFLDELSSNSQYSITIFSHELTSEEIRKEFVSDLFVGVNIQGVENDPIGGNLLIEQNIIK